MISSHPKSSEKISSVDKAVDKGDNGLPRRTDRQEIAGHTKAAMPTHIHVSTNVRGTDGKDEIVHLAPQKVCW
jgi:hypothetical protein